MELKIEKLDNQGRGIGFINDKIIFVPKSLPNEIVDIKITKNKKNWQEGKIIEYKKISKKRVTPICQHYEHCGGCDLMHMSYVDELEYKENKIKEIMKKYGDIDSNKVKNILYANEWNYRNKATFQVKEKVGYYKEKSYEIIPIEKCFIVDEKINKILNQIKKLDLKNIYQIVIRIGINESMIIFKTNGTIKIDENKLDVENIIIYDGKYHILKGNNYIIAQIGKYQYKVSSESFFQVNNKCVNILYSKVLEYVEKSNKLLDLYCGTGSIGIFLSDICNQIYGVEINPYAVEDAKFNAKLNQIKNIKFDCLSTSDLNVKEQFDTIIIDPPRSGLDSKTIEFLKNCNSNKIIYVSCDPITLARDLKMLKDFYNVLEITPVNMFPKTHHVECVSLLYRKKI